MEEDYYKSESINSRYNRYISGEIGSSARKKNHFEDKKKLRDGCSAYKIDSKEIVPPQNLPKWDDRNWGGPPIDYDPEMKSVYVDRSDAHTLLIGSTGSKKSRLIVMPMVRILGSAGENMVICDPKGEIYQRTSGFLAQQGYAVHTINLRNPNKSDCWNILERPYQLYCGGEVDKACELINDAAINLMPINGKDPYWDYSARDLMFGLTLLLFELCQTKQLDGAVANVRSVLKLRQELFFCTESGKIKATWLWKFVEKNPQIFSRLVGIAICPSSTMSCILSVFDQHMTCFSLQPKITEILSQTTFDLKSMEDGKEAIFLILPDEKTTFHKIVAIFVKQIYEFLIDNAYERKNNRYETRINFVLDEFSSLPQIPDFPQMISASRSRNIRFTLILQSKNQLSQRYEAEAGTIMSNCANWMFLTTRETELLKDLSLLSGTISPSNEPLMTISHLQHMEKDSGECLILNDRKYPYIAHLPDIDVYDEDGAAYERLPFHKGEEIFWPEEYEQANYFENLAKSLMKVDEEEVEGKSDLIARLSDIFAEDSSED